MVERAEQRSLAGSQSVTVQLSNYQWLILKSGISFNLFYVRVEGKSKTHGTKWISFVNTTTDGDGLVSKMKQGLRHITTTLQPIIITIIIALQYKTQQVNFMRVDPSWNIARPWR